MANKNAKGRPPSEDLDPDKRCDFIKGDGMQCGNLRAALSDTQRCQFHGGKTKGVMEKRKQAVVDRALAPFGQAPKEVRPSDFPMIAAEYVAHYNEHFQWVRGILAGLHISETTEGDAEFIRDNVDLLNELKNTTIVVTRLMEAAGKIGITLESHGDYAAQVRQSIVDVIVGCLQYAVEFNDDITEDQAVSVRTVFMERLRKAQTEGRLEVLR